jgi:ABC-2 type transport system ATP-binding protein
VAIIDMGKIIALDTPGALKEQIGGSVIRIESNETTKVREKLANVDWLKRLSLHNGFVDLTLQNAEKRIAEVIKMLNEVTINSVSLKIPTLEDVFLNYTGKTIREQEASAKDRMRQQRRASRR